MRILVPAAILASIVLAGCSGDAEQAEPEPPPTGTRYERQQERCDLLRSQLAQTEAHSRAERVIDYQGRREGCWR